MNVVQLLAQSEGNANDGAFRISKLDKCMMQGRTTQLIGWILFVLSAIGFIGSSARLGDIVGIAGGVLFLAGCLVFIAPLLRK